MHMLKVSSPRLQVLVDLTFALFIGLLYVVFVLGLGACAAQAQALDQPLSLADPLTALVARLGGSAALIYVLVEGAKSKVPWFREDTERAGLHLYLLALALGVAFGLFGFTGEMPGNQIAGRVFSGLGAATLAMAGFSGKRAFANARKEKREEAS